MDEKKTSSGAIYVVDELDFETKQNYDLIIRATDSVSGVYAEVPLSIAVSGNHCRKKVKTCRAINNQAFSSLSPSHPR